MFVPIEDIDGYVWALKKEGFYSDKQIENIRKKHQDALDKIKYNKLFGPLMRLERKMKTSYKPICEYDKCRVLMVIKNNKIRVKIFRPFEEYIQCVTSDKNVGVETIIKCYALNGATREFCEEIIKSKFF